VEALAEEAANDGCVQVGYNLRFHPSSTEVEGVGGLRARLEKSSAHVEAGSYLPYCGPWQELPARVTRRVANWGEEFWLDGSHEIDYVTWLFGAPREIACHGGSREPIGSERGGLCYDPSPLWPMELGPTCILIFFSDPIPVIVPWVGSEGKVQWDC